MPKSKSIQDKNINSKKTNKQWKHNESQISNDSFHCLCIKFHNAMCKNMEQDAGRADVSAKQCK